VKISFKVYLLTLILLSLTLLLNGCLSLGTSNKEDLKEQFPNQPIEVVVGWGEGGGSDIFARAISTPVADKFDVPVIIKNIPGVSETLASEYLLQKPADGYTVWALTTTYTINSLLGISQHVLDEFIPLARIQQDIHTVQVSKDSPFQNIDELVEYARENPGKLKMGGSGSAFTAPGFDEVAVALFEEAAGIDFNYIPFEEAGEMHEALFTGEIDVMVEEFGPSVEKIKEGLITPLLVFSDKRIEQFPELPASVEKGWDVTLGIWRGLMLKADTPADRVKILEDAFHEAYDDPGYKETERLRFWDLRSEFLGSEEFKKALQEEIGVYEKILKKLGYIK
jgi:putative tricarboxylic transport membrane protein